MEQHFLAGNEGLVWGLRQFGLRVMARAVVEQSWEDRKILKRKSRRFLYKVTGYIL